MSLPDGVTSAARRCTRRAHRRASSTAGRSTVPRMARPEPPRCHRARADHHAAPTRVAWCAHGVWVQHPPCPPDRAPVVAGLHHRGGRQRPVGQPGRPHRPADRHRAAHASHPRRRPHGASRTIATSRRSTSACARRPGSRGGIARGPSTRRVSGCARSCWRRRRAPGAGRWWRRGAHSPRWRSGRWPGGSVAALSEGATAGPRLVNHVTRGSSFRAGRGCTW